MAELGVIDELLVRGFMVTGVSKGVPVDMAGRLIARLGRIG